MWRKLPKNFGTTERQGNVKRLRDLDVLDKEACAEGDAIKAFKTNFGGKTVLGRRLTKSKNSESRGKTIVGNKRVTNLIKDHNAALAKYMEPQ